MDTLAVKLGEIIESTVERGLTKLSSTLQSSLTEQGKIQTTTCARASTVANTATMQITETAATYKEALLCTNTCPTQVQACPAPTTQTPQDQEHSLQIGLDRKARQILLDSATRDGHCFNMHEIKEKVEKALRQHVSPTQVANQDPGGNETQEWQHYHTIRHEGGRLTGSECPSTEASFTKEFDPDTSIHELGPPLDDPQGSDHLRPR
ncbi:hypothetical protein EDB87DRAFT_1581627 [Lactarius vividus]|nr:hypothetical protein EDB87DRAFT_1581627 [Lactarius vividus]